jgi:tetratricopeptide (TPR) repeat protein
MKGMECFLHVNKQHNAQARNYWEQSFKLDENSVLTLTLLGWTHLFDFIYSWSESPLESFSKAEEFVNKALSLNDSLDGPHVLMAWLHLYKKEYNEAIEEAKRAVALNPNGADSLALLGFIAQMVGEIETAIRNLNKAFRLNPIPPLYYYYFLGGAYYFDGQYEKAVEIINRSISVDSEVLIPYPTLICCYIELNKYDKAKKAVKKIQEIDPNYSLEYQMSVLPIKDIAQLDKYIGNLRKAGLPD